MAVGQEIVYDLYHSPYSICALMARMTIALRPKTESDRNVFLEHYINLFNEDQLTEGYLKVNPKGQVPALDSGALPSSLTDSVDITRWACDEYPELAPAQHREKIFRLLQDLHKIQYLSLTFRPDEMLGGKITAGIEGSIQRRLNQQGISDSYRRALEVKKE